MKRALLMTVGTGVGEKKDSVQNLARALLQSILHYRADLCIFFVSDSSKKTVESIKEQYHEHNGHEMDNYKLVTLQEVDNFDKCFQVIRQEIVDRPDWEIIVDYTSGTKTMTMSAAIASLLYHKVLTLVGGARGENSLVAPGVEEIKTQNLYSAYDVVLVEKMKEAFNQQRFETAQVILSDVVQEKNKENYLKLAKAYDYWDKFNHSKAKELIVEVPLQDDKLSRNKEFLGKLVNAKDNREYYLLADLLNNAQRRFQEGKYDDALARLYRAVEVISQTRLNKEYDIDTSNVDLELVPGFVREKYRRKQRNGKVAIGLKEGYKLLRELDDDLAPAFMGDERLKDLLTKRNTSILAHGFEPITGDRVEEVKELRDKVINLGRLLYEDLDELMSKAEFMELL